MAERSWEVDETELCRVDWDEFRAIARHFRLAGVIYHTAKKSPQFPVEKIGTWRSALIQHGVLNVRQRRKLLQMLSDLRARGVQARPFKGLVLAEMLYAELAVRPTTDFDLYVPFEGAKETADYFISGGYKSPYFDTNIPAPIFDKVYSVELFHPVRKDYIDIHWELTDGYAALPFSSEELMQRILDLPFEEASLTCFDDTVTAALIAVHGAKNSWDQLVSLLDLALFFRKRPDFDYAGLVGRLHRCGISRMLLVGAHLVHQFDLADVPDVLLNYDRRSAHIARRIARQLTDDPLLPSPRRWGKVALNLAFRESMRTKLSYIAFKMQPKKVDLAGSSLEKASLTWLRRIAGMS